MAPMSDFLGPVVGEVVGAEVTVGRARVGVLDCGV